jgi:hypothetical protein
MLLPISAWHSLGRCLAQFVRRVFMKFVFRTGCKDNAMAMFGKSVKA